MNRELQQEAKAQQFTDAVLDAVGYNRDDSGLLLRLMRQSGDVLGTPKYSGSDDPRFLLRLIFERLTDGEADDLLATLNTENRDRAAWEDGWILGMVSNLMEDQKYDCITYGDAAEVVALRLGKSRSWILKRLKERDGQQLQLLRERREQKLLGKPKLKAKGKRQFKRLKDKTKN